MPSKRRLKNSIEWSVDIRLLFFDMSKKNDKIISYPLSLLIIIVNTLVMAAQCVTVPNQCVLLNDKAFNH